MKALRGIATEVGKGLIAGFVGTVAITVASTIEKKLRKRPPSTAPADAAGKVLHVQPRDEGGKTRLANVVHYAYGTGWGLGRAALAAAFYAATGRHWLRRRRRSPFEPLAFFGAVWGAALVMLPALGIAKPFWRWGAKEVAIDALHHGVYAAATDGAYRLLSQA
jgi:drug/metabolite transporter (DMT)-like permease